MAEKIPLDNVENQLKKSGFLIFSSLGTALFIMLWKSDCLWNAYCMGRIQKFFANLNSSGKSATGIHACRSKTFGMGCFSLQLFDFRQ